MTPARFQRIRELFEAVLEVSPEHRKTYLEESAGDDPDLVEEVDRLLIAKEQTSQVLGDGLLLPLEPPGAHSESWVFEPGDRLSGRFEVRRRVGKGGMGEVYCALDLRLNRTVALKVIRGSLANQANFRLRLEQEARSVSALNHPNICQLFDIGRHQDIDYLVMEYIDGETLASALTRGPLPIESVVSLGAQLAHALASAHRLGLIHRDIKPGNILLTASGEAKLTDFGLARRIAGEHQDTCSINTTPGAILGTVSYMSPEQARGEPLDARSDLFSLGTVLYEAACGVNPFDRQNPVGVLLAILTSPATPARMHRPEIPAVLEHILARALEKDREARFPSAEEMTSVLDNLWQAAPPPADSEVVQFAGRTPAQHRRVKRMALILLAPVLLLAAVTVGLIWKNGAMGHRLPVPAPADVPAVLPKAAEHEAPDVPAPQVKSNASPESMPPPKNSNPPPVKPDAAVRPVSGSEASVTKTAPIAEPNTTEPPIPPEGRLVWAGDLQPGQEVDLGANPDTSGSLPGVPITIEIHPLTLEVITPPSPANHWRHLVVRNGEQKLALIIVKWVRVKD